MTALKDAGTYATGHQLHFESGFHKRGDDSPTIGLLERTKGLVIDLSRALRSVTPGYLDQNSH
jgi:hypothetical protein